jgi:hypothetical protein
MVYCQASDILFVFAVHEAGPSAIFGDGDRRGARKTVFRKCHGMAPEQLNGVRGSLFCGDSRSERVLMFSKTWKAVAARLAYSITVAHDYGLGVVSDLSDSSLPSLTDIRSMTISGCSIFC